MKLTTTGISFPRAEKFNSAARLIDKFGLAWQIVPEILAELLNDSDAVKSERTMKAMLGMKKLDVTELKKAHTGK